LTGNLNEQLIVFSRQSFISYFRLIGLIFKPWNFFMFFLLKDNIRDL
jgi:hypothetical protein